MLRFFPSQFKIILNFLKHPNTLEAPLPVPLQCKLFLSSLPFTSGSGLELGLEKTPEKSGQS